MGHGGASYWEVENMTRGHESEKAAAEPLSARAPVRIWRRILDDICWMLGVVSACRFQLVMIMVASRELMQ